MKIRFVFQTNSNLEKFDNIEKIENWIKNRIFFKDII